MDEIHDATSEVACDVLVIGGGTAGPMAALKAKLRNPAARVVLLEKANVKRSGAISMGMDGLNNAVIPATPRRSSTPRKSPSPTTASAIKRRSTKYAERCFEIIQELDRFGIRFQRDGNGDYDVKKVHHLGTYVLPMPNGDTSRRRSTVSCARRRS